MFIELDGDGTLDLQIYRALRAEILAHRLLPAARLPSTRSLAVTLGVSRNVVLLAYEQLLGEGYAQARVGSGTIVAATLPHAEKTTRALAAAPVRRGSNVVVGTDAVPSRLSAAGERAVDIGRAAALHWDLRGQPLTYDFRFGRPAFADFPQSLWCRLLGRRARAAGRSDLDYQPPQGRLELRQALAERLRRWRGIEANPERIVIVNGSQQGLDLIARVLIDRGDRVVIEEPHYLGARWVFTAAGAELVAAPVDEDGMQIPKPVAARLSPRLAYVTPSHQFPTGVVMPLARRLELIRWAVQSAAYVVEDDYDSEYRYSGRPLPALASLDTHGRVIYLGTFSKLMFPALRLGYLVLPESLVEPIVAAKALADTGNSGLDQLTLADFIGAGHFERHLNRARAHNRGRRAALLAALTTHFGDRAEISGAATGLHMLVWLRGRKGEPITGLARKAAANGVGLYSVAPYYLQAPRRSGALLGYAALSERQIGEGVARLATALR